jgi:hypothetical protein
MSKEAVTDYPVQELIAKRWSPYGFLAVHQMIGILPDKARDVFAIPAGVQAVTAIAIGYAADPTSLPENLKDRDTAPRQRKPLSDFVFAGQWGETSPNVKVAKAGDDRQR